MPGTSGERAFGAPAGCIRTELHPPPFMGSRRLRTSGRVFLPPLVGTTERSVPPRSSRRNAPRGQNSSRSRNLRFAPISRGVVQPFSPRGRRGGCAAHGAVAPGLCYGPRYAAIWRSQATTISRRLAALATRPSATAPRRLWASREEPRLSGPLWCGPLARTWGGWRPPWIIGGSNFRPRGLYWLLWG